MYLKAIKNNAKTTDFIIKSIKKVCKITVHSKNFYFLLFFTLLTYLGYQIKMLVQRIKTSFKALLIKQR